MRALLLTLTTCLLILPAQAQYSGGSGTAEDPYQIATAADLIALGETADDYDKHFILTADIDLDPNLPGGKVFDRAVIAPDVNDLDNGFQGPFFTGVFDGSDHTISHLTISRGGYGWGLSLFGETGSEAVICNVGLEAVDVNGTAGLVGCNAGSICQCYATGTVKGSGGLVGRNTGSISQCYFTGTVNGSGGLVGSNAKGEIAMSYSMGTVNGSRGVGGLVGRNLGCVILSYSTADVSANGSLAGGLIGDMTLRSRLGAYSVSDRALVSMCYSTGRVTATDGVGGLAASHFPDPSVVQNSFWNVQTSGQAESAGGIGLTTAEMQDIQTYLEAGWDFVGQSENGLHETWHMPEEGGYPVLAIFNGYTPAQLRGKGTVNEPYLISDAVQLGAVAYYSDSAHYQLAASIDLSGIRWGIAVVPWFKGTFDGNDMTISHMTITGGSNVGLFGLLETEAEVTNLGLLDVNITDSIGNVGALVGHFCEGSVERCYSTGSVRGDRYVGGLVGSGWYHSVTTSYSTGTVTGDEEVGGLMGCVVGTCWDDETASFWDVETSGQTTRLIGTGLTTAEMQTASTFLEAGWDFIDETDNGTDDIWWILEGQGYPRLWWQRGDESPL